MTRPAPTRGRVVSAAREKLGIAQEDLARRCGCRVRTIQRIESGETASVSERIIAALHRELEIPLRDLVRPARKVSP